MDKKKRVHKNPSFLASWFEIRFQDEMGTLLIQPKPDARKLKVLRYPNSLNE